MFRNVHSLFPSICYVESDFRVKYDDDKLKQIYTYRMILTDITNNTEISKSIVESVKSIERFATVCLRDSVAV